MHHVPLLRILSHQDAQRVRDFLVYPRLLLDRGKSVSTTVGDLALGVTSAGFGQGQSHVDLGGILHLI
jgi:hypothetical protein